MLPTKTEFNNALRGKETLSVTSPNGTHFYLCKINDGTMYLSIASPSGRRICPPRNQSAWYDAVKSIYNAQGHTGPEMAAVTACMAQLF